MKVSGAIVAAVLAASLWGCGSGEGNEATAGPSAEERAAANAALEAKIGYPIPKAPPQKKKLTKLVVRDVNEGKGPASHWGDEVNVRYVARVYRTGKIYSRHWSGVDTFIFRLDGKSFGVGWQRGIEGMRVGGRREILVPARLLFNDADVAYMVTMLWMDKRR
jgi:FKBP-type peptidyl-prolyl cis-trans isomerase